MPKNIPKNVWITLRVGWAFKIVNAIDAVTCRIKGYARHTRATGQAAVADDLRGYTLAH